MEGFEKYRELLRRRMADDISNIESFRQEIDLYTGRKRELLLNDLQLMESYRDTTRCGQDQHFRAIIKNGIGVYLAPNKDVSVVAPKNTDSFEDL